jgi:hypothetical protein
MWLFLPDAFYSVRSYDPVKGGIEVQEPHVVIRGRLQRDIEKVRRSTRGSFNLPHGSDYRYHLAVSATGWIEFLARQVRDLDGRMPMKAHDNPRTEVHTRVWTATGRLNALDGNRRSPLDNEYGG